MMKLLHSADWHLDSPLLDFTPEQAATLRSALLALPDRVVRTAKATGCQLILLSGDLFDGPCTAQSLAAVQRALAEADMPVCIAPGNHDPMGPNSPWSRPGWSENVHIFTGDLESVTFPGLDCRVYGAAFTAADSPSLLEGFVSSCSERHAVGVFHGDPLTPHAHKNTVTREQVRACALDYLALGHIHKGDSFRAGETLCAWPGCPMGRGYDELGEKGVYIVTLDGTAQAEFVTLDTPRFYWIKTAPTALERELPAANTRDFYRVELTGESEPVDLAALQRQFAHIPNLTLTDRTTPPLELWARAGDDSLEGVFFSLLRASDEEPEVVQLAARISRQLLLGQEVVL